MKLIKSHLIYTLLVFLILPLCFLQAEENNFKLVDFSSACSCQNSEPENYETAKIYIQGQLKNQCIDSCRFRKIILLEQDLKNQTLLIANIFHDNRFWQALVSLEDIQSVDLILERFMNPFSHVALRFRLKTPMTLFPLTENLLHLNGSLEFKIKILQQQNKSDLPFLQDLVFSPESALPAGELQKFLPSLTGDYVFVHRLQSIYQARSWMVDEQNNYVEQLRLNIARDQAKNIFLKAVQLSHQKSFQERYWLLAKNCSTIIADLLVPHPHNFWKSIEKIFPMQNELGLLRFLKENSLIDSFYQNKLISLNDEVLERKKKIEN